VSGTAYALSAQDAFYIPASGAQLLQNTGYQPVVIPANIPFPLTNQWNVFYGGAIQSFNYTSAIVVPQTIQLQNDVPFTLPTGSYFLQYPQPQGVSVELNTGTIYFPNNVVQVDLVDSLPTTHMFSAVDGADHNILLQNTGGLVNPFTGVPISLTTPIYVGTTEYQSSTDTLWSPVSSIVMTTTYVPVINEYSSNPLAIGTANTGFAQNSGNAFARILVEDALNTDNIDYYKYQPLTPTMSSLSPSHEALNIIDFQFKWRNRLTNELIPMKLPNSGTVTVRLLFKKKGVE
jgi:hypothetical protein